MDTRTKMRELDEVIRRVQSAAEREATLVDVLPDCGLRRKKQAQVRTMRTYVHRLQRLRSAVIATRRAGVPLS